MKPNNPFLISGYYSPEYFCDRNRESQTIINALYNGRGITLIAPRRMGKTGLVKHVFHKLKEIFDYLKSADKRCYIAIDEFQQVTDYPEKGVEALLRSYIQFIPSVNSAIKKLVNSELVCKTAEGYVVCDRFMGEWLRNQGY